MMGRGITRCLPTDLQAWDVDEWESEQVRENWAVWDMPSCCLCRRNGLFDLLVSLRNTKGIFTSDTAAFVPVDPHRCLFLWRGFLVHSVDFITSSSDLLLLSI